METFSEDQLNDIVKNSIPFPLLFSVDEDHTQITQAYVITDVGQIGIMGIPEYIELEKISATGMVTTARYILSESYKAHESAFENHPEDN